MRPTRMPHRRRDAGFCAAARIASPVEVKRKNRNSSTSMISVTPITPRSWVGDQPLEQRPLGNGLGNVLDRIAVDPTGQALKISNSPMVTTTAGQHRRILAPAGSKSARSAMPPRKETGERDHKRRPERHAGMHQRPGDDRWRTSPFRPARNSRDRSSGRSSPAPARRSRRSQPAARPENICCRNARASGAPSVARDKRAAPRVVRESSARPDATTQPVSSR